MNEYGYEPDFFDDHISDNAGVSEENFIIWCIESKFCPNRVVTEQEKIDLLRLYWAEYVAEMESAQRTHNADAAYSYM